jgi:RimJ/RimL family protein N-acetyltransferase
MSRIVPLPVRLMAADRAAVTEHFLRLDADDRRLRFGASLSDEALHHLEERIDFGRDEIFGVTGDDLRLLGVVHVAFYPGRAELGLSVLPEARGQGVGAALFSRAVMHLTNRGMREVFVHCVRENGAMMRLARRNGMRLVAEGGEADGFLELPRATVGSVFVEWIWDQNAQFVQAARRQANALSYLSHPLARKA